MSKQFRLNFEKFERQDFLIIKNLETNEITELGIPNSMWGEVMSDFLKIIKTFEYKNLELFNKKQDYFNIRKLNKALKESNEPIHLFTGITQIGNRKQFSMTTKIVRR